MPITQNSIEPRTFHQHATRLTHQCGYTSMYIHVHCTGPHTLTWTSCTCTRNTYQYIRPCFRYVYLVKQHIVYHRIGTYMYDNMYTSVCLSACIHCNRRILTLTREYSSLSSTSFFLHSSSTTPFLLLLVISYKEKLHVFTCTTSTRNVKSNTDVRGVLGKYPVVHCITIFHLFLTVENC